MALEALSVLLAAPVRDEPPRLTAVYVAELVPAPTPARRVAPAGGGAAHRPGDRVAEGVQARSVAATPVESAASAPSEPARRAPEQEAAPPAAVLAQDLLPDPLIDGAAVPLPLAPTAPLRGPGADGVPSVHAEGSGETAAPLGPDLPARVDPASSAMPGGLPSTTTEPLPTFEWPPSTRLSYVLTGHYRGELHGFAQVEWLREGDRYQVHLEVIVGLPVAPFMSRRMSSDGRLGPEGLVPGRYDEVTRIAWRPERAAGVTFEGADIRLANGRWLPRPPGVQDTASQFVQMAYLFNLDPDRLTPGRTIALPLALPRRLDTWVYDILDEEQVDTPFGPLVTIPLRPRPLPDRRDTLSAEVWIAPSLRFLPVRLRIRQDDETYVDLMLSRAPEMAAR